MTKLVPVVEPRFFAFNVQHLIVTSTSVFYSNTDPDTAVEAVLMEGGKLTLEDSSNIAPFPNFLDYVRVIRLDADNNKRLWLMQSLLTLLRETHHDATYAVVEALLDPDASLDYLMGIQRVIEEVYREE